MANRSLRATAAHLILILFRSVLGFFESVFHRLLTVDRWTRADPFSAGNQRWWRCLAPLA